MIFFIYYRQVLAICRRKRVLNGFWSFKKFSRWGYLNRSIDEQKYYDEWINDFLERHEIFKDVTEFWFLALWSVYWYHQHSKSVRIAETEFYQNQELRYTKYVLSNIYECAWSVRCLQHIKLLIATRTAVLAVDHGPFLSPNCHLFYKMTGKVHDHHIIAVRFHP